MSVIGKLEQSLRRLRDAGEHGLIPYVTAGDPDLATTGEMLVALSGAGVAALEVGIPFSDPIADGPVIQQASQRALAGGATLRGILEMLQSRRSEIACPVVLFGYLNPIAAMGYREFAERASAAGVDGVLLTDAPPGCEPDLEEALAALSIPIILLVAPTTSHERLSQLASQARGFVYVIARRGVTGSGSEQSEAAEQVAAIREHSDVPTYVGFGVSTHADAERIWAYADGVVVGRALVAAIHGAPAGEHSAVAREFVLPITRRASARPESPW